MRKILVWNNDSQEYSVKHLTEAEEKEYNTMIALKARSKALYNDLIDGARQANMPLDLFIDNEAYTTWQLHIKYAEDCNRIAQSLGLRFEIPMLTIF